MQQKTTYFIAENGQVRGPFAESQIMNMWNSAGVQADAQLCEKGREDWQLLSVFVEEKEQKIRSGDVSENASVERRAKALIQYDIRKKSEVVGIILSLFIPWWGVFYAGERVVAVMAAATAIVALVFGAWPVTVFFCILGVVTVPGAVSRANRWLAEDLGI
jgi:hypothetical protein